MVVSETALETSVRESNAFEGIAAEPGCPLFDSHLAAARRAAEAGADRHVLDPREVHRALVSGVVELEAYAGMWREGRMDIIGRDSSIICNTMPAARYVPRLMRHWRTYVQDAVEESSTDSRAAQSRAAYMLHAWLLWVHPFADGNGRVARIIGNNIRLACRLPWIVPDVRHYDTYLLTLRHYENTVFWREYPYVMEQVVRRQARRVWARIQHETRHAWVYQAMRTQPHIAEELLRHAYSTREVAVSQWGALPKRVRDGLAIHYQQRIRQQAGVGAPHATP